MKPLVAIVGRPNVGKSTLFNRIVMRRVAIVEGTPGVTRDRLEAEAEWTGSTFRLVDTGGLDPEAGEGTAWEVQVQSRRAVAEADVVLFMVDGRKGVTPTDMEIAETLRRHGGPVILVVNKIDSPVHDQLVLEFHSLGLGQPIGISAEHGRNTGDLLDRVVELLGAQEEDDTDEEEDAREILRVAIVGRPNVGKSSLLNALVGDDRVIVSPQPGTTRDAVDVPALIAGVPAVFVDTAGMRKKARVEQGIERYGVSRALKAIDRAHVVLHVLDATDPATEQDQRIAGYTAERGRAAVLLVNKWDLVEKNSHTWSEYQDLIRSRLHFVDYAPCLSISAVHGLRVDRVPDHILRVRAAHLSRQRTPVLNRTLAEALERHQPPMRRGGRLRLYYVTQVGVEPPSFLFFVNDPKLVHDTYQRYLMRVWREKFDLEGTPIRMYFRPRRKEE